MATLNEIRALADECAKLESRYLSAKERAQVAKEIWQSFQARLTELCRSHHTSEEVANRPLIKAVEQVAESNGQPVVAEATTDAPDEPTADYEADEPAHHGEPVESWGEARDRQDEADALEMLETANKVSKPKSRKSKAKAK